MGLTSLLVLAWGFVFMLVLTASPPRFLQRMAARPYVEPAWIRWIGRHAGGLSTVAAVAIMAAALAQLSWWVDSTWPLALLYAGLMAGGLFKAAQRLLR